MKKCNDPFSGFLGNEDAKTRVAGWLARDRMPHALLITALPGCGRNTFAGITAAAYLGDEYGLVARDMHPDCLVVAGEGASGNIPVRRIRELAYELNLAAVSTNGRRVALLKDVADLNKNSANALLKILEEPPAGVLFLLTASYLSDVLETIRSRCVAVPLLPLEPAACAEAAAAQFPDYDRGRIDSLSALYGGRYGLVRKALAAPERLALADAALRFCDAAVKGDRLGAQIELESAATREDYRTLLQDAALFLRHRLDTDRAQAAAIGQAADAVAAALDAAGRYTPPKLSAAFIATQFTNGETNP